MLLHKRLGFVPVYFETPEVGSGGQGTAVAPGQPAGQVGGNEQTTADGFNWGLFPDVPEDQRPLLQPHLRTTLGHVTRMEEQYAPFKSFIQAGIKDPNVINGLLNFSQAFDNDPSETWFNLGRSLQEGGVISDEIDFDEVKAIMDGTAQQEVAPQLPDGVNGEEPLGMALSRIDELESKLQGMQDAGEQERVSRQQALEDRLLNRAVMTIKTSLGEAGIPDEAITDPLIHAALITHRGDVDAVVRSMTGFRNGSVSRTIREATTRDNELTAPRGAPPSPERTVPRKRDAFSQARTGAEQFLRQQNSTQE